jgi:hypothetical protein
LAARIADSFHQAAQTPSAIGLSPVCKRVRLHFGTPSSIIWQSEKYLKHFEGIHQTCLSIWQITIVGARKQPLLPSEMFLKPLLDVQIRSNGMTRLRSKMRPESAALRGRIFVRRHAFSEMVSWSANQ